MNSDVYFQTGMWEYTVTNTDTNPQRISVIVRSQAKDPDDPPVVARAFWAITGTYIVIPGVTQRLFATVSKGETYTIYGMMVKSDIYGTQRFPWCYRWRYINGLLVQECSLALSHRYVLVYRCIIRILQLYLASFLLMASMYSQA